MKDRPLYAISVAAEIVGLHPQTLRQYEKLGLIAPARTEGNTRLYSDENVEQLRYITALTKDMGVNREGVKIIMEMREQINFLNRQLNLIGEHIRQKYGEDIALASAQENRPGIKIKVEREE